MNSLTGAITDQAIYLTGFMGSGKSTAGPLLAHRLERPFVDLDREVECREKRSAHRIFTESGEPAFRRAEHRALAALSLRQHPVVATGGGILLSSENRRILSRTGVQVWFKCPLAELVRRMTTVSGEDERRPLWSGDPGELGHLLEQRTPAYAGTADLVVDAAAEPEAVVTVITAWLEMRNASG